MENYLQHWSKATLQPSEVLESYLALPTVVPSLELARDVKLLFKNIGDVNSYCTWVIHINVCLGINIYSHEKMVSLSK